MNAVFKRAFWVYSIADIPYHSVWLLGSIFFPVRLFEAGASPGVIGLLTVLGPLMIMPQFFWGKLSDYCLHLWGTRTPLVLSGGVITVCFLLGLSVNSTIMTTLVCMAGTWMGISIYQAGYMPLMRERIPASHHHRVKSQMTIVQGGVFLLLPVMALTAKHIDHGTPYILAGILTASVFLLIYFGFIRKTSIIKTGNISWSQNSRRSFLDKKFLYFYISLFLMISGIQTTSTYFIIFTITEIFRMSPSETSMGSDAVFKATMLPGIIAISTIFSVWFIGKAVKKFHRILVLQFSVGILLASSILFYFVATYEQAAFISIISGPGVAAVMIIPFTVLARLHPPDQGGSFTGLFSLVVAVAQIFAIAFAGYMVDLTGTYRIIFVFSGFIFIFSLVFLWKLYLHTRT